MPDAYFESLTEDSDFVTVSVKDSNGTVRVFHLNTSKVMLRYVSNKAFGDRGYYNPKNIKQSGKFNSHPKDRIELVIISKEEIELEVFDNEL